MKGHKMKFKPLKYLCVAVFLVIACVATRTYATEGEEETTNTNLPYIEMKVNSVKVGETNQILVECWASNFTYLEGIETVFTYDSTKLTPSYISGENQNEELSGLESIKYVNRPETTDAQEAFDKASKSLLVNSFAFDSAYTDVLAVDVFRYMATEGNNEALQVAITKPDYLTDVSATTDAPVLIGTFSFKQTENTIIEENEFEAKRIKIVCDDGLNGDDLSAYMREAANDEDCTEIMEFTYGQYGSISGSIEATMPKLDGSVYTSKNIATVKIYEKDQVSGIDWTSTDTTYLNYRNNLPQATFEYTTTENDNGKFTLDKVPFGEYVMLIDKTLYADYIVTDIVIDSTQKDIQLDSIIGNIQLIVGDIDKNGKLRALDKNKFLNAYDAKPKDSTFDLTDDGYLRALDKSGFSNAYNKYRNKTIKTVVSLTSN